VMYDMIESNPPRAALESTSDHFSHGLLDFYKNTALMEN
jgi:hypothetical protein